LIRQYSTLLALLSEKGGIFCENMTNKLYNK